MLHPLIHNCIESYIQNQDIAGASLIVKHHGETVHEEYAGYADIENRIPITPNTLFRLASMTKPIIAVSIMMAEERGLLSIADEIARYIPEFGNLRVSPVRLKRTVPLNEKQVSEMEFAPLSRPVTIEDLLRHRSGIGQGAVSAYFGVDETRPITTLKERVQQIAACPLDFQPGTASGYSPKAGFDIMARILEIVTGSDIASVLKAFLFEPLGMSSTLFFPNAEQLARVPRLYKRPENTLIDTTPPGVLADPFAYRYPCGSGGLFGTLTDYEHFARMLANGGEYEGNRILGSETVRRMAQTSPLPQDSAWGLGMTVFKPFSESGRSLSRGTFGWSGAFGTHFYIDPVNDLYMVLMANRADINGADSYVSHGVEKAIFDALHLKSE